MSYIFLGFDAHVLPPGKCSPNAKCFNGLVSRDSAICKPQPWYLTYVRDPPGLFKLRCLVATHPTSHFHTMAVRRASSELLAQRFVHLHISPRPANLSESREIYRVLQRFGPISKYYNLQVLYHPSTLPSSQTPPIDSSTLSIVRIPLPSAQLSPDHLPRRTFRASRPRRLPHPLRPRAHPARPPNRRPNRRLRALLLPRRRRHRLPPPSHTRHRRDPLSFPAPHPHTTHALHLAPTV